MFQISDKRMLELINSRDPKSRKKYKQDWLEAIQMLVQDWTEDNDSEQSNALLETILTPRVVEKLNEQERQKMADIITKREKKTQSEETDEKKTEE